MKIYIGRFNEDYIRNGKDKDIVKNEKAKTGLKYTLTKFIKRKGEIIAMDIWLCDVDTYANTKGV